MKISKLVGVAAVTASLAVAGCGKNEAPKNDGASGEPKAAAEKPKETPINPAEVSVAIGKKKLTRGEIEADISKIVEMQKGAFPEDQLPQIKKHIAGQLVQHTGFFGVGVEDGIDIEVLTVGIFMFKNAVMSEYFQLFDTDLIHVCILS